MKLRLDYTPTADETARLIAAVAYATRRRALERKAKAAVKARRFDVAAKLAQEARELDRAVLGR